MYFDQNVLKILYSISDETDIPEIEDAYFANCMQSALEGVKVYKLLGKPMSDDFLDESVKFEALFEEEDIDLEMAQEILERLRQDEGFNEIYEGYLDAINDELYNKAIEKDPTVVDELQEYLKTIRDSYIVEYFNRFVTSAVEIKKKDEENN